MEKAVLPLVTANAQLLRPNKERFLMHFSFEFGKNLINIRDTCDAETENIC